MRMIREHATFFITVCATDARFTSNTPSMVAAAAVASAIQILLRHEEEEAAALGGLTTAQLYMQDLYDRLHAITLIDTDCLKECHRQIEIWTQNNGDSPSGSTPPTPTDMRDVNVNV
ncbi:G1/S-specific cyclin-D2-like [Panulirus ornatus]|uniref:G1/S-specific cyclin-D2-like n=1 Tax=Panulirus ornatus TaxID=150431 RepID=UPI003A8977F0